MTPERRAWLSGWKEQAVALLPSLSPVTVKAELRQAVAKALASYSPEDASAEIRDLVSALVVEVSAKLAADTQTHARGTRKEKLLQVTELLIDDNLLRRLPVDVIGKPGSVERRARLAAFRQRVRERFEADLTGDETMDVILQRIQEELAMWALEQNPEMDRRSVLQCLAPWILTTLAGGVAAAALSPELKAATRSGARMLKERLAPYKPVAAQLWASSLEQVELWAIARAQKKDPE
jgi:hypothetical protein